MGLMGKDSLDVGGVWESGGGKGVENWGWGAGGGENNI